MDFFKSVFFFFLDVVGGNFDFVQYLKNTQHKHLPVKIMFVLLFLCDLFCCLFLIFNVAITSVEAYVLFLIGLDWA